MLSRRSTLLPYTTLFRSSAIASPTGLDTVYGLAVPIDLAKKGADDLIRYGRVRRPAVGIQVTNVRPEDAEVYSLERIEGVVAQDFPATSPAREAGLRQGDVIVAVDGRAVQRVGQFQRMIATRRPGEQVTLDVIRYGKRERFQVRLGEAPNAAEEPPRVARREEPAAEGSSKLGVAVSPVTPEVARECELEGQPAGVVVTEVERFGAAGRNGIGRCTRILAV